MFKNMKIEINEHQPLDEVVRGLERLGYEKHTLFSGVEKPEFICSCSGGDIMDLRRKPLIDIYREVTLAELKEMK